MSLLRSRDVSCRQQEGNNNERVTHPIYVIEDGSKRRSSRLWECWKCWCRTSCILHMTKLSHHVTALWILQNERTWQTLGKTNEVSGSAKPIIRVVRYPTSVCIMLIIREYKGAFHSMEAYGARTTKYNRLNQTSCNDPDLVKSKSLCLLCYPWIIA